MTALANIPTGQAGYEDAVLRGLSGGLEQLDHLTGVAGQQLKSGLDMNSNLVREAIATSGASTSAGLNELDAGYDAAAGAISPIASGAGSAQRLMMALSGASGSGAQSEAYSDFISSPGQKFLRDRGERAVLRNASAIGGVGGGNVMKRLLEHGTGVAAQDFGNAFSRLGSVADRGFSASQYLSGLRSNQGQMRAGMVAGDGRVSAEMLSGLGRDGLSTGSNLSSLTMTQGLTNQGAMERAGGAIGDARLQTGRDIASSISSTTNALSQAQSGDVLADLVGGNSAALANLVIAAQSGDANASEQLAQLLANLAAQQSGSVAGLPSIPGVQEQEGMLARILGAVQ